MENFVLSIDQRVHPTTTLNRQPPEASRRQLPTASVRRKRSGWFIPGPFGPSFPRLAIALASMTMTRSERREQGLGSRLFRRSQLPRWFSHARNKTGWRVSAHSGRREGIISGEFASLRPVRPTREVRADATEKKRRSTTPRDASTPRDQSNQPFQQIQPNLRSFLYLSDL